MPQLFFSSQIFQIFYDIWMNLNGVSFQDLVEKIV
jgi:hypothetical protein